MVSRGGEGSSNKRNALCYSKGNAENKPLNNSFELTLNQISILANNFGLFKRALLHVYEEQESPEHKNKHTVSGMLRPPEADLRSHFHFKYTSPV